MPERTFSSPEYRYGFNGKEKDEEGEWGSLTHYDYGFRIYNPGIGRFLSVDPLTREYPFYTPYQFAGNKPILAVDIDGLEPDKNPVDVENQDRRDPTLTVKAVYGLNGGDTKFDEVLSNLQGQSRTVESTEPFRTDTDESSAEDFNLYVNSGEEFLVDDFELAPADFASLVLGTLVTGRGPENLVFPENGFVSSQLLNSDIVTDALINFRYANVEAFKNNDIQGLNQYSGQSSFGLFSLFYDFSENRTVYTVPGVVGSAAINIISTDTEIKIQIFNVTSITSGDFGKHFIPWNDWPTSNVREQSRTTRFGNVSQTFNLSIPISDKGLEETIKPFIIRQ